MNERKPLLSWENAGKAWTIISIPFELFLVGHGLATHNGVEVALGAGGLMVDFFAWKWLNRDKQNQARAELQNITPAQLTFEKGSQRTAYRPASLPIAA